METFWIGIAWMLPRKLVYWCAIRVMTERYDGGPDARTCADALKGWNA